MRDVHYFKYICRQALVFVALIGGAIITLATSPVEPEFRPEFRLEIPLSFDEGVFFISWPLADEDDWSGLSEEELIQKIDERNFRANEAREVLVSALDPSITLDCELALSAPLDYLDEQMFTQPTLYTLFQGDVINVEIETSRQQMGCEFFNVVSGDFNSTIVAVDMSRDLLTTSWSTDANGVGESRLPPSTLVVQERRVDISEYPGYIHSLTSWTERQDSDWRTCSENYENRLDWLLPAGPVDGVKLSGAKRGVDGCHELSLSDERVLLICAPWEALSFLDRAWWISAGERTLDRSHTLEVSFFRSLEDYEEGRADVLIEGLRDWSDRLTFRYPLVAIEGCEPVAKACGQSSVRLAVDLSNEQLEELNRDDGHPPLRLPDLAPGKKHWLLNAEREVTRVASCDEPERFNQPEPGYYFENFVVTYLGGE